MRVVCIRVMREGLGIGLYGVGSMGYRFWMNGLGHG